MLRRGAFKDGAIALVGGDLAQELPQLVQALRGHEDLVAVAAGIDVQRPPVRVLPIIGGEVRLCHNGRVSGRGSEAT